VSGRRRGRAERRAERLAATASAAVRPGLEGGRYRPLGEADCERIHRAALRVLDEVGMASPIPVLRERALERGCRLDEHGRLCFPPALVEDRIAATPREFVLYGREPALDVEMRGARVHFGGGGEPPTVVDLESGEYRPATLRDCYDLARLVDALPNIHTFARLVVATDLADPLENDLNTCYASIAGTGKHTSLSFLDAAHVAPCRELLELAAGGPERYARRPFCHGGGCPVVSPLAYGADNSEVCVASVRLGAPVSVVIAPQAGATAPAALAGTLVQVVAETLAALLLVDLVAPGHPVIFGAWPFVSDLRSGSFSGGGGEQAVLAAGAAQMARHYGLVCSVGAGMSDAKVADFQAGHEKGLSTALAALAGANSIGEAAGMLASLLACSYEALVLDDELLGSLQRALRGIEVSDETLSVEVIKEVARGPGHFLGHPQTLALMDSEYLYPVLADRRSPGEWREAGGPGLRERARERARSILASHYPRWIDARADARIRTRFPVRLPAAALAPPPAGRAGR